MFVTKLQKLFDMTKPQLVKVRALFYVLQHIIKRGCAYFDTAPFYFISTLYSSNLSPKANDKVLLQGYDLFTAFDMI